MRLLFALWLCCGLPAAEIKNLTKLGYIKPRHSKTIADSPWGIQAGTLDEKLVARAAEIGVKWTRLGASWSGIEKQKGQYNFTETDQAFATAIRNGITPFVTLGSGNPLYTPLATYDDPKLAAIYGRRPGPPTSSPEAMRAWLAYVKATVGRYQDRIAYWEIWNEPNHEHYWGAKPDGREYGRLVKETATLIRSIAPKAVILAGATAGLDAPFIDAFLGAGTAGLIDIVTFHQYGGVPEERIYKGIEVRKVIDRHNPKIRIWQGECGYPSHSSTRDYRGRSPWGVNIQAKWLLRQGFTDTFFLGAGLSNYFKLVDMGDRGERQKRLPGEPIDRILGFPERGGSRVRTVGVNEKCLLSNPDLKPKPGYFAYQNLCALMDGRYQAAPTEYEIEIRESGPFYGIGAEDDAFPSVPLLTCYKSAQGKHILAYWLPWYPAEYLPGFARVDLKASGVVFRSPVLVDLLSGEVYGMRRALTGLPLADYPFAIVEKEEIEIVRLRI
ncbi:MAG: hypothetical protein ACE15B_23305 [Bryobacteraceae bacterium]